ncbi:MAG: hypothetical protein ACTHN5_09925 [Phycisphaerae bacterium]
MIFELERVTYNTTTMTFVSPGDTHYEAIYVTEERDTVFGVVLGDLGIDVVKVAPPHVKYLALRLGHPALHEAYWKGTNRGSPQGRGERN